MTEISTFLHDLARLRSPARHDNHEDHAERAAVLTRKAELVDRIAEQHTGTNPTQTTQARAAAAHHAALVHPTSPTLPPQ